MQVDIPTTNAEEAEVEWFYEDLQVLLELTPIRAVLFIIGDWNAKVGSQEIPGVIGKFDLGVQNEAGQRLTVLPKNTLVLFQCLLPKTQEMTLNIWTSPYGQYRNQIGYILCRQTRSSIQSAKQDQELTVAQTMNSLLPNSD